MGITIGDRLGAPAPNLDEDTNPNERTNERTTMFSKTKTAAIACAALAFSAGCADAFSARGRLRQQVSTLDTVEGLIPQRINIDPYIDFMPLAELEAEAPAFENAPYPRAGVNFAAGPQGDAAPGSQVNETPVVQDDAIDNATDLYSWNATDATGLEWNATDAPGAANTTMDLLNDAIPTGIQGAPLNSTANGTIVNDAGNVANLTISSTED